jgi:large subunit ribosomal protein L27
MPGTNVAMGKDHTLFATVGGQVVYRQGMKRRTFVSVMPESEAAE